MNLTKERDDNIPLIRRLFSKPRECNVRKMEPLMQTLEEIAKAHDKSIAQVSINWLATNPDVHVFPIPGTRNVRQAESNLGAVGWSLTMEERQMIDRAEKKPAGKISGNCETQKSLYWLCKCKYANAGRLHLIRSQRYIRHQSTVSKYRRPHTTCLWHHTFCTTIMKNS